MPDPMLRLHTPLDTRNQPEPYSTAGLPNETVDQRFVAEIACVWQPDRLGRAGIRVWMDSEPIAERLAMPAESYRGDEIDGLRLTPDEARYVAALLYAQANALLAAAEVPRG
jgi:hypothetical protein